MAKKKYESFDDPFDLDLLEDDLELSELDLPPANQPVPTPPADTPRRTPPSTSEIVFRATQNKPDADRPLQGNYQYVNLLLPAPQAKRFKRMAEAHRMMMQPFMRWVVDQMALMVEENGIRPGSWEESPIDKQRVAVLMAPMMADLLRSWARENRMKFQPFMRWLTEQFITAYYEHNLQPEEPEEFVPDEAALYHWASRTVEKFSGTGKTKGGAG